MAIVGSNFISGITSITNSNDVVNKDYVDQKSQGDLPIQDGNAGKYLITTDGTSVSWENISKSQEFTSVGIHTVESLPVSSNLLYIEATGGGGGGSVGGFVGNTNIGIKWYARSTPYYQGSPLVRPNTGLPPGGPNSPLDTNRSEILDITVFGDIKLAYSPDQNVFVGIFKRDFTQPGLRGKDIADYDFWPPSETGLIRSTDGVTWSIIPSPVSLQWNTLREGSSIEKPVIIDTQIIYAGGKFVGFISNRPLFYSTNGINWQLSNPPVRNIEDTTLAYSLGYGNGIYLLGRYFNEAQNDLVFGYSRMDTSTDAIHWTERFDGRLDSFSLPKHFIYGNNGYIQFNIYGEVKHSTDAIVWTLRTCGFRESLSSGEISSLIKTPALGSSQGIYSKNNYLAIVPFFGYIIGSTDSIVWTIRTSPATTSNITPLVELGNYGILMPPNIFSTDGIVWIQSGNVDGYSQENVFDMFSQTYYPQYNGRSVYIGAGTSTNYGIYASDIVGASYGGSGSSYSSWYVPKSIVSSNITVNVGSGGRGSTTEGVLGNPGAGTTISWTAPGGQTIYLTSPGGGSFPYAGVGQTNGHFYITSGAPGSYESSGNGGSQTNRFQPSGGGAGSAQTSTSGGSGGTIDICGFTSTVSGGTPSSIDGNTGIAYPQIVPYGNGGGGGGSNVSSAGRGGNGVLGGGGGGGASIGSTFGFGGNGGDGYARITWV